MYFLPFKYNINVNISKNIRQFTNNVIKIANKLTISKWEITIQKEGSVALTAILFINLLFNSHDFKVIPSRALCKVYKIYNLYI